MGRLFAVDGKLVTMLSKIADLVILNLLFLLCSLPVVTIGASSTALYGVTLKMARNEDSYPCSSFFRAFKENFKQATGIWAGILAAAGILYFDFYFSGHMAGAGAKLLAIPLGLAAFLTCLLYSYVFPILSYFENSTKKAVKNALLMGIAYLPYSAVILLVNFCPFLLLFGGKIVIAAFWDVVIGFALASYANAHLFRKLFDKVTPKAGK